jgi:hypothetical protein
VAVESVTITVKVTVPLWVGVPDNVPAPDNAIRIVAGGNGPMAMVCSVAGGGGRYPVLPHGQPVAIIMVLVAQRPQPCAQAPERKSMHSPLYTGPLRTREQWRALALPFAVLVCYQF